MTAIRLAKVVTLLVALGVLGTLALLSLPPGQYRDQFWPSGLVTATLLVWRPRPPLLSLVVITGVALTSFLVADFGVLASLGFAVAAVVEGLIVTRILRPSSLTHPQSPSLRTIGDLVRFLLASTAGALSAALLIGGTFAVLSWPTSLVAGAATFVSHLSSELVIVPFFTRVHRHPALARPFERVLQWSVTLAVAVLLFLPLGVRVTAFSLIPLIAWGAMRLAMRESQWQLLSIVVLIAAATSVGRGNFARLPSTLGLSPELRDLTISTFIVDCILVVVPLGIAVGQQIQNARFVAAERDKLEGIVNAATGVAIIGVDVQSRITLFNPGAERMLGYSAQEVHGLSTRMFLSDRTVATKADELGVPADFFTIGRVLANPEHAGVDMGFLRKDGEERVHSMTLRPLTDEHGELSGFVSTSEDVTERVRAASVLREALAAEREAVDRLIEVDAVKDAFVSTVSHELRTPITSILGYLELLTDGSFGGLNRDQADALSKVATNSTRLLALIDDLLTLSRVQQDGMSGTDRAFDLREVVTAGYDLVAPSWRGRDLAVAVALPGEPVPFVGDKEMIERVVVNLLTNAVKFTPEGGHVRLGLAVGGDQIELCVTDTGIGVPDDEQAQLFTRFFRASSALREAIPGTGLGLSITRAIVENHGGTICYSSPAGVGSSFEVRMPYVG